MLRKKNIVYSTNKNLELEENSTLKRNPNQISTLNVKIIKKKANKITTVIENFNFNKEEIQILAKELKKICSSGGTVKENKIIIQGNFKDKIATFLIKKSFKIKIF